MYDSKKLILHCGGTEVGLRDIERVDTPQPTDTWQPIPHLDLIDQVNQTLKSNNLTIVGQQHGLSHGGNRYFGLMQIANGQNSDDYSWVLGLRNSHDQVFPAGMVAGSGVFVCDNLAFSGEIRFARKHTRYIVRDLPGLVQRAVGRLMDKWHDMDKRIAVYKDTKLTDMQANDIVVRAFDVKACTLRQIPAVLSEWRKPRHEAFEPRTAWSLFNSFTEVAKAGAFSELPGRTERLHGLFDSQVGLTGLN